MNNLGEQLILLYLFREVNIKEIDIYNLSKSILNLRTVMETYTTCEQNKNKNENIK